MRKNGETFQTLFGVMSKFSSADIAKFILQVQLFVMEKEMCELFPKHKRWKSCKQNQRKEVTASGCTIPVSLNIKPPDVLSHADADQLS